MDKKENYVEANKPPLQELALNEDTEKMNYCKDVSLILVKNASEHFRTLKTIQKLKFERLKREREQIDSKIAAMRQQIEKKQHENQKLDRKLYSGRQLKNQTKKCFERTGQMIDVMTEETKQFMDKTKMLELRHLELSKKLQELSEQKKKQDTSKKQIELLRNKINVLMTTPEPHIDQNLVEKNLSLKKKLQEKQEILKNNRLKKSAMNEIKNKNLKLLQEITEKQEKNKKYKEEVEKKKSIVNDTQQKMNEKLNILKEKLTNDTQKRNSLLEETQKSIQYNEEINKKIAEKKDRLIGKQEKLQDLNQKIEGKQNYLKETDEKKQKEYNIEKEKIEAINKQLQNIENETESLKMKKSDKAENIFKLKDKKRELMSQLCNKKNQFIIKKDQTDDKKKQVNILRETYEAECLHIEDLKVKELNLQKTVQEVRENQKQLSIDFEQRRKETSLKHKEKFDELLKGINVEKANIECLMVSFDGIMKNVESLKTEIKVEETKLEMNKKMAAKLEEKNNKEKAAYEKLAAQFKEKEKKTEKFENNDSYKDKSFDELRLSGISSNANKSIISEFDDLILRGKSRTESRLKLENEINLLENEDDDNKSKASGRKSPGILKSPFKKPNQQQNKRVTFDGISSDSSTRSLEPNSASQNTAPEQSWDEILKEWSATGNTSIYKKRKMNF